jgi:hypothetical protein
LKKEYKTKKIASNATAGGAIKGIFLTSKPNVVKDGHSGAPLCI